MKFPISTLMREPMLHFLLLGTALFATNAILSTSNSRTVVITEREINNYLKMNAYGGVPPNKQDSILLTEKHITKKILLAEARKRQFDRYDPVVTERLIDRMQLALVKDTVPDDEQAMAYYHAHPEKYQTGRNAHLTYEAVKTQVLNDLMMNLREESYKKNLQDLIEEYTVRIEKP